jgi:hypothetical protein
MVNILPALQTQCFQGWNPFRDGAAGTLGDQHNADFRGGN